MPAPTNTDLPTSNLVPGVYVQVQTQGGAALDDSNRRALIIGHRLSTGTDAPNTPTLYNSQDDINTAQGQGSEVARAYAAFQAQHGDGWGEVWGVGISERPATTAATQLITVAGTATEAGYVDVYVAGYRASVGIANLDTAATIGTAIYTALGLIPDLPVTLTDNAAGLVTLTYRHLGLTGNDLPVRVDQFDAAGLTFSPGTMTVTGNPSAGGNIVLTVGATTITSAIDHLVQTTAALAAAKFATDVQAADYPVTAETPAGAVVTLLYRKGRFVRRIDVSDTVGTTTTAVACGTAGAGTAPSLATALANISALNKGFAAWVNCITDPSGATAAAIDEIYDQILVDTNGVNQKPGCVFIGSAHKLATAGLQVTAANPDLTTTNPLARWNLSWCREAGVQAFEIAARHAAEYLWSDYFAKNLDGAVLNTRGTVPLLAPATADIPTRADLNAAMVSYYMSPISVDATGQIVIVSSKTTSNATNQDLRESATIRQVDTARKSLRDYLVPLFSGKSYRTSQPKTPNTVSTTSVKDAIYAWTRTLDDQDLFDDAEAWKDAILVNVNGTVNTRFDAFVPLAIIRCLHQLGVVVTPR